MTSTTSLDRRACALEAAFSLFARYGYRKTSMDDLARGVGVSRQALYLWFPSKQALFEAVVDQMIVGQRSAVEAALADDSKTMEDRLVAAFDAYHGAYIDAGMTAATVDELLEASSGPLGTRIAAFQSEVVELLADALRPYERGDFKARDLAELLHTTSVGLKSQNLRREDYRAKIRMASRLMTGQLD